MAIVRVPLLVVLLSSVGCATLQPLREPAQYIAKENPKVIYVTYKNRSVVGVAQPRVSGDSLYGTLQGQPARIAVPLSAVQLIEAIQPDGKRTALLIAGLTVFTVGGVYILLKTGKDESCDVTTDPCGGGEPPI
jgi:hypothetical protein